jgi:hypothetical protein
MNRDRIAKAYDKIAEGYAELALAFAEDTPSREAATAAGAPPPAPVADLQPLAEAPKRLPPRPAQDSAFTKCPAHDKPFTEGKFGPYCTSTSEDPEWSNDRGYCRVTPRSAVAWLKQHPSAA